MKKTLLLITVLLVLALLNSGCEKQLPPKEEWERFSKAHQDLYFYQIFERDKLPDTDKILKNSPEAKAWKLFTFGTYLAKEDCGRN